MPLARLKKIITFIICIFMHGYLAGQAPLNDNCNFAQVVIIPDDGDTCVYGTLTNATDDGIYNACDSLTLFPLPPGGHEVWFTYIATGTNNTITVTPAAPVPAQFLSVTIPASGCAGAAYNACNNASGPGGSATASWIFTPGIQVWFSVTALASDGDFSVCVSSFTPPPVPAIGVGDDCSTAIPICDKHTFISPGPVFNNATGPISCYPFGPQNVLWYKFTAGTSDSLIWMATPNPGYELDWSLNDITAGCPGVPVACNYATAPGGGAPTGMASGSLNPCGPLSQICTPIVLTAGNTYALHFNIENFLNAGIDTPAIKIEWGGNFKMAPYADFLIINSFGCDTVIATFINNSISATGYQWDFGNGNSSVQANPPPETYTVPGTYIVSLTASNPLNCASITTHGIMVYAKPPADFITSDSVLCVGENDTINYFQPSNPNYTYSWNFAGGNIISGAAGSSGPYVVNWGAPGYKNVELTVTEITTGCSSNVFTKGISVITIPDSTFSIPSTACEGEVISVTFTGIQTPGNNYTWDFGGATVSSGSGPGPYNISFAGAGNYNVALSVDFNGCFSDDTNQVTVIVAPVANAGPDTVACSGESIQIGISGSPPGNYSWTYSQLLSDSTVADPFFSYINSSGTADTLELVLSVGGGQCVALDTMHIIVQKNIVSSFTLSDDSLCGNESAVISYTGNAATGAVYSWSFGNGIAVNTSGQDYTISWPVPGNDSILLYVEENGCFSDTTVSDVVIGSQPVAIAGSDRIFCSSETDTLGGNPVPGVNYSWSPSAGLSSSSSAGTLITLVNSQPDNDTLLYILTATKGFCESSDTVTVIVKAVQQASISGPSNVCIDNDQVQFINNSQQVTGALFSWNFGNAIPSTAASFSPPVVEFLATGQQWIYLTGSANSCPVASDSLLVTVNAVPASGFVLAGAAGCPPLTVTFTDTSLTQPGSFYLWNFGNGDTSSAQNPQYTYLQQGTFDVTLTVITPDTCSSTYTAPGAVNAYDLPVPAFTASPQTASILNPQISFTSQSVNTNACSYAFGDGATSALCDDIHLYEDTGSYTVYLIATSSQGCVDTASLIITIEAFESLYIPNAFSPNNDGRNDVLVIGGSAVENFGLEIFNRWGQMVYTSSDITDTWDGSDITTGIAVTDGVYVYKLSYKDSSGKKQLRTGTLSVIR
jgi:gliding motility-associated-like protein